MVFEAEIDDVLRFLLNLIHDLIQNDEFSTPSDVNDNFSWSES